MWAVALWVCLFVSKYPLQLVASTVFNPPSDCLQRRCLLFWKWGDSTLNTRWDTISACNAYLPGGQWNSGGWLDWSWDVPCFLPINNNSSPANSRVSLTQFFSSTGVKCKYAEIGGHIFQRISRPLGGRNDGQNQLGRVKDFSCCKVTYKL